MTTRPTVFPFIDTSLSNIYTDWQSEVLNLVGFAPGDTIPSKVHNTLWLIDSLWVLHFDYDATRLSDVIDTTEVQRMSSTDLSYTIGGNVLGGGGASVATGTTVILNGYRVVVDKALLRPSGASPLLVVGATAPGRIWIYVDTSVISPPGTPRAGVRVESAGVGAAAAPIGSEYAAVGVDIDAAGFVTGNVYASAPSNQFIYSTREQRWTGLTYFDDLATFGGALLASTAAAFTSASATPTVTIFNSADDALDVQSPMTATLITAENIAAMGSLAQATISGKAIVGWPAVQATGSGVNDTTQPAVQALGGTGVGLTCSATGFGAACYVTHTGSGYGVVIDASSGTGAGVNSVGGNSATGYAVQATATHASAHAVRGTTAIAANATTYGCVGLGGATSGSGVLGQGQGDGYGVVAQADTTSPVRSAFRMVPQDADPTTPQQGDVLFNSSRGPTGKIRTRTVGQWESVHSTAKGYVFDCGSAASGSVVSGATSADISLAQVSPETTGDVEVMAVVHLDWSADIASVRILLRDVTLGLTINGGGVGVPVYPIVGASGRAHPAVVRMRYTLPTSATRTFSMRLTAAGGNVTYTDATVSVRGVL